MAALAWRLRAELLPHTQAHVLGVAGTFLVCAAAGCTAKRPAQLVATHLPPAWHADKPPCTVLSSKPLCYTQQRLYVWVHLTRSPLICTAAGCAPCSASFLQASSTPIYTPGKSSQGVGVKNSLGCGSCVLYVWGCGSPC